jgi:hypothetical protein
VAVGYLTGTQSHNGPPGSESGTSFNWTHTESGSPQGVIVMVFQLGGSTDYQNSVTYGSLGLTRISDAVDTAGEPGRVTIWFAGALVPTGNQTVTVNRDDNATELWATCATLSGLNDLEVYTSGIQKVETDGAYAEIAVTDGTPPTNSMRFCGAFSGLAAPPATGGSSTGLFTFDTGQSGCSWVRETTVGTGSRSVGVTGTSDDRAGIYFAVREQLSFTARPPKATALAFTGKTPTTSQTTNIGKSPPIGHIVMTGKTPTTINLATKSISVEVLPPRGYAYVNIVSGPATGANTIKDAFSALTVGDQIEYKTTDSLGGTVTISDDGTVTTTSGSAADVEYSVYHEGVGYYYEDTFTTAADHVWGTGFGEWTQVWENSNNHSADFPVVTASSDTLVFTGTSAASKLFYKMPDKHGFNGISDPWIEAKKNDITTKGSVSLFLNLTVGNTTGASNYYPMAGVELYIGYQSAYFYRYVAGAQTSISNVAHAAGDRWRLAKDGTTYKVFKNWTAWTDSPVMTWTDSAGVIPKGYVGLGASYSSSGTSPSEIDDLRVGGISEYPWSTAALINVTSALTVTGAAIAQAQEFDSPTLTQQHSLTPAALAQGQTFSEPVLTQQYGTLSVAALAQGQTFSEPTLARSFTLNCTPAQTFTLGTPDQSLKRGAKLNATTQQTFTLSGKYVALVPKLSKGTFALDGVAVTFTRGYRLTITPPVDDPYAGYNKSLLNFNAATDATGRHTLTANGTASFDSTSKFGSAAGRAPTGGANYFSLTGNLGDFALGTQAFTIDLWWRTEATSTTPTIIHGGDTGSITIWTNANDRWIWGRHNQFNDLTGVFSPQPVTNGQWYHLAVQRDGSNQMSMYFNGTRIAGPTTVSQDYNVTPSSELAILQYKGDINRIDDFRLTVGVARYSGATITVPQAEFTNGAALVPSFAVAGSATNLKVGRTLNATPNQTFALEGIAVGLNRGRTLSTGPQQTFALNGVAVPLNRGYTLNCTPQQTFSLGSNATGLNRGRILNATPNQTFSLGGVAVGLNRGRTLSCGPQQTFALNGVALGLLRGEHLYADPNQTFELTGVAVNLNRGRKLDATPNQTFSLTGVDINLTTLNHYTLSAGPNQTFDLTGSATGLNRGRTLNATPNQTFELVGVATGLNRGVKLNAGPAQTFTLEGIATGLRKASKVNATTEQTFTLNGVATGLNRGAKLFCTPQQTFELAGSATGLNRGRTLSCAPQQTFSLNGEALNLKRALRFSTGPQQTFDLTGYDVALRRGVSMPCVVGEFELTGIALNTKRTLIFSCGPAAEFTLGSNPTNLFRGAKIAPVVEAFTYTGNAVTLFRGFHIGLVEQAFTLTGPPQGLTLQARLPATSAQTFDLTGNDTTFQRGLIVPCTQVQFDLTLIAATLAYQVGFYIESVDGDNVIAHAQSNVIILPKMNQPLFAASGNRVTIDQAGVRRNQLVTAESTTSITITTDLVGFEAGPVRLYVHRPRA